MYIRLFCIFALLLAIWQAKCIAADTAPQCGIVVPSQITQGIQPACQLPPSTAQLMPPACVTYGSTTASNPAIAVDNDAVYVAVGGVLYKLNKQDLSTITSTPLAQGQSVPSAVGKGPFEGGPLSPDEDVENLLAAMIQMPPAQLEQAYMQAVITNNTGANDWSRLAATKATRPEVRKFASTSIQQNIQVNQKLSAWTRDWYGIRATTNPVPSDQRVLTSLQNLQGREFDIAYLKAIMNHYTEIGQLSQTAGNRAMHSQLKQTAADLATQKIRQRDQLRTWLYKWYGIYI